MAKKFYAVQQGRVSGVYQTWEECRTQVHGYSGAVYKSFSTAEEAMRYVAGQSPQQEQEGEQLIAYVDGSYYSETGEFSYGVVILHHGSEYCFQEKLSDPELAGMRNVAGEIKGAEAAMRYALEHGYRQLTIYHDYEGIARWCTGEWKANKSGTKAYKAYYESISDKLKIRFEKVKGHSGNKYNDMADHLAKQALRISKNKGERQ